MKNVSYNWIYIGFGLIRSLVSLPDPKKTVMRSNLHLKREVCSEEGDAEVFLTRLVTLDLHGPREGEEGKRSMKNITLILAPTDTAQVSMQSITVHIISFQQMASHTLEFLTKEHAGRMCPLAWECNTTLVFHERARASPVTWTENVLPLASACGRWDCPQASGMFSRTKASRTF